MEKIPSPENINLFESEQALLKSIHSAFNRFQTHESMERLELIESLRGQLQEKGVDTSFLIYGSTAFGMAVQESDIDVKIVYKTEIPEEVLHMRNGFFAELYVADLNKSKTKVNVVEKPFDVNEIITALGSLQMGQENKMQDEIERFYLSYIQSGVIVGGNVGQILDRIKELRIRVPGLDTNLKEIENTLYPYFNFTGGSIALREHFERYLERLGSNEDFQKLPEEEKDREIERIRNLIFQMR